jgi:prepilin-type N-terminal cleavage/methylation domain-containing protein
MLIIIINKKMKKLNLRAFTFVELMIVMIIIAILGVV